MAEMRRCKPSRRTFMTAVPAPARLAANAKAALRRRFEHLGLAG
jgi:hypothetical protein